MLEDAVTIMCQIYRMEEGVHFKIIQSIARFRCDR